MVDQWPPGSVMPLWGLMLLSWSIYIGVTVALDLRDRRAYVAAAAGSASKEAGRAGAAGKLGRKLGAEAIKCNERAD